MRCQLGQLGTLGRLCVRGGAASARGHQQVAHVICAVVTTKVLDALYGHTENTRCHQRAGVELQPGKVPGSHEPWV